MVQSKVISVDLWGDHAAFAPPNGKLERTTTPAPTPSAIRGILSAIYSKPIEFYWQVVEIAVLNPIRYTSFKRNELQVVASTQLINTNPEKAIVCIEDNRTQRMTQVLKDVRYRVSAVIVPRPAYENRVEQLYQQAVRRIRGGKTFYQPSLGYREFDCYFEESDFTRQPIDVSMDLGLMTYDIFDLHDYEVRSHVQPKPSLYHAVMKKGVITVPPYDSDEVLKGGYSKC